MKKIFLAKVLYFTLLIDHGFNAVVNDNETVDIKLDTKKIVSGFH